MKESFSSAPAFHNYPRELVQEYNHNNLTFHFSAIDWQAPDAIQYSFYMEGLDKAWSVPQVENKVIYRNIPHGQYTLKVKAIGLAHLWSEPFEYSFTILPPWWHTWWARSIYGLLGILGVTGIVKCRTASLRRRQIILEQTLRNWFRTNKWSPREIHNRPLEIGLHAIQIALRE